MLLSCRSYFFPKDRSSLKRYLLIYFAIMGAFMCIFGPLGEEFVVHPLITLLLAESSTVTPDTPCFDHRVANQTCPDAVALEYYFWNITNSDEWMSGLEAPKYEEIGPYAFKTHEVRYNLTYSSSWEDVEFTYHQWAEFDSDNSCDQCSLNDTLINVNRAYLQFISSSDGMPTDSESSAMFALLPSSLKQSVDIIGAYVGALYGSSDANQTLLQWSSCSPVEAIKDTLNLPSPFVKDIPAPNSLPYHPEFCHYIVDTFQNMYNISIEPSQFPIYDIGMSIESSQAFLELAIGNSNATYQDAAAQQFLLLFLTYDQATVIQYLTTVSATQLQLLSIINSDTWSLLKGYIAGIMTDSGKVMFNSFLTAGGGGLVINRQLHEWLYGYQDPVLLLAAQSSSSSYALRPWEFTPSLALTFPSKSHPTDYFGQLVGRNLTFGDLSWNSSDIGRFMPLIQQKKMQTGKNQNHMPQSIQQYRGVGFRNESWGIINMTGQNEGILLGDSAWQSSLFVTFDSALSRPISTEYSGNDIKVKKIDSMLFVMSNASKSACNWTAYQEWADDAGFDPALYRAVMGNISASSYGIFMSNDTYLSEYLENSSLGQNFSTAFGRLDIARDRCMVPDQAEAIWDVSSTFACPTVYTLPRFMDTSQFVRSTTGNMEWNASIEEHAYGLAVEPMTGISVKGHKTYQLNHLVSRTSVMYPSLWVLDNSSIHTGYEYDFVTVPVFWVRMSWEPKDSDAYLLRAMRTLISYMYTILVIAWPSIGFVTFASCMASLCFGKDAKERAKEIKVVQESRADPLIFRTGKPSPQSISIHVSANDVILQSVSEAVGIEDASDEEDFISTARLSFA